MSRAFVNEDASGGPRKDYHLPPRDDPDFEAAAAAVLLESARSGDTASAEDATGFRWGDAALADHVKRIGRDAERAGDDRLAQLARRYLGWFDFRFSTSDSRAMKKLLFLIALLAGAVGIAAIIGALLPRDHVAAMSVVVSAPQVKVWTTITDPGTYPSWRKDLKSVEVVSPSPLSWTEKSSMGDMTLEADVFQPPSHMVASIAEEKGAPFGGEWEYKIEPDASDPNKCKVTIIERGWVSNVVFRFASRFVFGHETTIKGYLRALSAKFGPEGTPVSVTIKDSSSA